MCRFGILLAAGLVLASAFSFAAAPVAYADSRVWPTGYWGPLLSCTGNYNDVVPTGVEDGGVTEVCDNLCDMLSTGQNIVDFVITIVVFVGVPAMIAFAGVLLLISGFAGGDSEKRSKAKDIIISTVVGLLITLGAYVILSTFLWLAGNGPTSAVQVSWPDIVCKVPPAEQLAN